MVAVVILLPHEVQKISLVVYEKYPQGQYTGLAVSVWLPARQIYRLFWLTWCLFWQQIVEA